MGPRSYRRAPDAVQDWDPGPAAAPESLEPGSNTGSPNAPADLSGGHLGADDAGQDFTFPAGTTLAAGQSIRVYTNGVTTRRACAQPSGLGARGSW
jgi:hypothetical protein